jgi:hypothetical protein
MVTHARPGTRIVFNVPFHATAGMSTADMYMVGVRLAEHLAAADGSWPTGEAHVRVFPVTEFRLVFEVTPWPSGEPDEVGLPDPRAAMLAQLDEVARADFLRILGDTSG